MDSFKERERGYENMYVHDLEVLFLARVRAHYQTGLWAAGLLGKTGEAAEAYAEAVRMEDIKGKGRRAVAERIERDLGDLAKPEEIDAKIFAYREEAEAALRDGDE